MDKISKLLRETRSLLDNFSSGSLSPVSDYLESEIESEREIYSNFKAEFRKLIRAKDESKILRFIEGNDLNFSKFLHIAIEERCKYLEVFKALLRVGCDPLETDFDGKTALTLLFEQVEKDDNFGYSDEIDHDNLISTLLGEWELRRSATRDVKLFKLINSRSWKDLYEYLKSTYHHEEDLRKIISKPDPKFAGMSPLHEIAATNNVFILKKLLSKYPSIDLNVKAIGSGNTLLHEATHMSCSDMVTFLLERGARCNVKNAAGRVPAHLGTEKIQVIIEIQNMITSKNSSIESIASNSQNNNETEKIVKDSTTMTKKRKHSTEGKQAKAKKISFKAPTTKHLQANDSLPLSREERKLKQIIELLDQISGDDLDDLDDLDFDDEEAKDESKDTVEYTKDTADYTKSTLDYTKSTVDYTKSTVDYTKSTIEYTMDTPKHMDTSILSLDDLLERESHSGRTILHRYARRNQTQKLLKFLKNNNFSDYQCKEMKLFQVIDNSGHTPLHDAAAEGSLECAKIFLFGSSSKKRKHLMVDPSIPAAVTRDTPLHFAAEAGHLEIVELLLEVGASRDLKNIEEKRPIDVCYHKNIKKLLQSNDDLEDEVEKVARDTKRLVDLLVPVKRGPGRPRKYPHLLNESKSKSPKRSKEEETVKQDTPQTTPSSKSAVKIFNNLLLKDILPLRAPCLLLVKFDEDWLFPVNQFTALCAHLKNEKTFEDDFEELFYQITRSEQQALTKLPRIGPLIELLQVSQDRRFISKRVALKIIEKRFGVSITGPFGYVYVPKLITDSSSFGSGRPLKLKWKFDKEMTCCPGKDSQAQNIQHLQEDEAPRSPKSFLI